MTKTAYFLLLVIALVGGYDQVQIRKLRSDLATAKSEAQEPPTSYAKVAKSAYSANSEQQAICSKQAKSFFVNWVRHDGPNTSKFQIRDYSNHFDAATNSCYIQVIAVSPSGYVSRFVSNVDENSRLADYTWVPKEGYKYWEVKPIDCSVRTPDGEEKYCSSDEEYQTMVRSLYGIQQ